MNVFGFKASFTSHNNWKIRLFPKPVSKIAIISRLEIRASNASLCSAFRVSVFEKHDKHSCSASTCQWFWLLTVNCQRFTRQHIIFLRCEANAYFNGSGCAGSLSFFFSGCCPHLSRLAASLLDALSHTWLTEGKRETIFQFALVHSMDMSWMKLTVKLKQRPTDLKL